MRYLLLSILMLFSVSMLAAEGTTPDGWYVAAVELRGQAVTKLILMQERLPRSAGEQTQSPMKLIPVAYQPDACHRAAAPFEVGWRKTIIF